MKYFIKLHKLIVLFLLILLGCNSEPFPTFTNGDFSRWEEASELIGWTTSNFSTTTKVLELNDTSVLFKGSIGNSKMSQRVSVTPGNFYVLEGSIDLYEGRDWNVGVWIEGKENLGYHVIELKSFKHPTLVKVKFQADQNFIDIKLGFQKFGTAKAVFNNFTLRESEDYISIESDIANLIKELVQLDSFDSLHLHQNVLLMTEYVNSLLITPLNNYYNFQGDSVNRERLILKDQISRDSLRYVFNSVMPTSYLQSYLALSIRETANAYCVKSSNSAHDILGAFGLMTRQIHFYNVDGNAVHQCFEYWNPYANKWIIIDPFYGISYVNASNELIGFEELNILISQNQLSEDNLVHLDIQPFYFNLEGLQSGWHKIKLGRSGSDRITLF